MVTQLPTCLLPDQRARDTRRRSQAGFTMIELVIGIAVLAILGSIAVAGYSSLIGDAAQRAAESDLKTFGAAMAKHYSTFGQYPTSINTTAGATSTTTSIATSPSDGVTLALSGAPSVSQWAATATHAKRPGMTCTLTVRDFGASKPACAFV